MSMNFDLPRITAADPEGQVAELRSYIWQLVEKLNYAFNYIDLDEAASSGQVLQTESGGYSGTGGADDKEGTTKDFVQEIKSIAVGNWSGIMRVWKSGLREAWLKVPVAATLNSPTYGNTAYRWTNPQILSPLPEGFTPTNIITAAPSLKLTQPAIVTPYISKVESTRIDIDAIGPVLMLVKGDLLLYLAAKKE